MYPLKINTVYFILLKKCIPRLLLIKQTIFTKHCNYCDWPRVTIQSEELMKGRGVVEVMRCCQDE